MEPQNKKDDKKNELPSPPPLQGKLSWGMGASGGGSDLPPAQKAEFDKYTKETGNLLKDKALMKLYELSALTAARHDFIKEAIEKKLENFKQGPPIKDLPEAEKKKSLNALTEELSLPLKVIKVADESTFKALHEAFDGILEDKGIKSPTVKAIAFVDFVQLADAELGKRQREKDKKEKVPEPKKDGKPPLTLQFSEVPDKVLATTFSAPSTPRASVSPEVKSLSA